MNGKVGEGWAVGGTIRTSLVLAVFFLFASGADAASMNDIQQQINTADFGAIIPVYGPDIYQGYLEVNNTVILLGINNPVLTNSAPGAEIVNITMPQAIVAGFTITGFAQPGSTTQTGIRIDNHSPEMTGALVAYNNIINNEIGLVQALLQSQCGDSGADCSVDASPNFWGPNGVDSNRGKPGENPGDANNGVKRSIANVPVTTIPWLTANVIDVNISSYIQQDVVEPTLQNPDAGVDVALTCTGQDGCTGTPWTLGSALYNESPYAPNLPGEAIKFVNVFVKGCPEGTATVTISYDDASPVIESTLKPYVLKGNVWTPASDILITPGNPGKVQGTFDVGLLDGSPIALVGKSYIFSISPAEPSQPITTNPDLTISINSLANIGKVYYQLDHFSSTGWNLIDDNGFADGDWTNEWSLSSEDWANVASGSHTFYFKFEREGMSSIGNSGELKWRFVKGNVPPPSPIVVTSPKAGDTLTRNPWKITWTMPSPENVLSVDLWFARDGDFTMRGGLNNPLHLATLGADTSYLWRSPNFKTDTAKIAVVVMYNDGTQFVGFSDDFSLAKGYSFHAYKPTPKTPWQLGSGVSRAVAVLGSWFNKPHIPYVIG